MVDGLQQAGLALSVVADEDAGAMAQRQVQSVEVAVIENPEAEQLHSQIIADGDRPAGASNKRVNSASAFAARICFAFLGLAQLRTMTDQSA